MRVATWAINERDGVLKDARSHLPPASIAQVEPALDVVLRSFVNRLSGAAVLSSTLEDIRAQHGASVVLVAAQAIARALRVGAERRAHSNETSDPELPADLAAISATLDHVVGLLDPGVLGDFDIEDSGFFAPRPTLMHALDQPARLSSPTPSPTATLCLLRVKATTLSAARALASTRPMLAGLAAPPTFWDSALDELLLVIKAADGAHGLVHIAAAIARAVGPHAAKLQGAIVVVDDALEAVVRAGALASHGGLVLFDEQAWSLASSSLEPASGADRAIDPLAPFTADRWQRSGLLVRPPVLGRDEEMARLVALLRGAGGESAGAMNDETTDNASAAAPATVVAEPRQADTSEFPIMITLHGPAGIGKTSLVRAALHEAGIVDDSAADSGDAAVLWGHADGVEPLAPIAAMLRALAGAPVGHPRSAVRVRLLIEGLATRLEDGAARELVSLTPIIAALLGTVDHSPPNPLTAALRAICDGVDPLLSAPRATGTSRRSGRVRAAVRRAFLLLIEALATPKNVVALAGATLERGDSPIVMVITGAEALDAPSRDIVAFAAARLGKRVRVLLLSSTRLKLSTSFHRGFRLERMELRALAAAPARALVAHVLHSDDDPASFDPMLDKGRGSPLALLHALRFAVEGGLLLRRDDRWDLGSLDVRSIPIRLDRLLQARVDRLPTGTRSLLSACALLGPVFLPAAAELVGVRLGKSRDQVARELAFLVDTGFLARLRQVQGAPVFTDHEGGAREGADRPLVFEHPLMRAAAVAAGGHEEKTRLHGLAAEALEATGSTTDSVQDRAAAASLARHYVLAGQPAQALDRLLVAARRSALFGDCSTAVLLAQEGLALSGDDPVRSLPLLMVLEECVGQEGGRANSAAHHQEILARLARASDSCTDGVMQARALVRIARYDLSVGDAALAEDAAARAIAALATPTSATTIADASVPDLHRVRARIEAARVLASARAARGNIAGATLAATEARLAIAGVDDHEALAALDHLEGALCLQSGELAAALEHFLAARGRRACVGDMVGEASCLDVIASLYSRRGRLATALTLLGQALRLRERGGDDEGCASTLRHQAEVLLTAGDDGAALAASLEARALAREHGRDDKELAAGFLAVRAHLSLGELAAADALVEALRKRARNVPTQIEAAVLGARVRLARAASSTGASRERALRAASSRGQQAMAMAEKHAAIGPLVAAMATVGECRLLEGDAGAALTFVQQAVELLDGLAEGTPMLAIAEDVLAPYARVLIANGDHEEAAAVRARAAGSLEQCARHLSPAARERFWSAPRRAELRVSNSPTDAAAAR